MRVDKGSAVRVDKAVRISKTKNEAETAPVVPVGSPSRGGDVFDIN